MNNPLRVIVIEDDYLLSATLKDGLERIGCTVLAQAANLRDGMLLTANTACDFAVVDLDLKGEMAFPLLDQLHELGIPFVMATGAYPGEVPARHANAPRLSKPYNLQELRQMIDRIAGENLSQQT